jgi:phospholipid transport system substrate-binding protein
MHIKTLVTHSLLFVALFAASGAYAEINTPDALVKNTANEVLEILKSDKDIQNGDMHKIGKLVEDKVASKFDFDLMSGMVLGPKWAAASKEQQGEFIVEFRSLLIRVYSSALSKYRDQTIEYKPSRSAPGDTEVKVRTQIIQAGGPAIPLNYSLEKIGDSWKVYDVVIDGISLVTTYHGQFADELKLNGINGVIQKLAEKNNKTS